MKTYRCFAAALLGAAALFVSACSTNAPRATLAVERTQVLQELPGPARVGEFSAAKAAHDKGIGLRGASMKSPYGSYARYLGEAITQDLKEAGRFDAAGSVEVSGELLSNDMHILGIVTGRGEISARFIVRRNGEVRYDAVKSAELTWDSHFVGGIAVNRAVAKYPEMVGKLLFALYSDAAFTAALQP